jgi:single-strand DNA-binding protein
MNDTFVTLQGWVGGDVTFRTPRDIPVATFRVASTPRFKKGGEWQDGETTWYRVTAWRSLAENVRDSVHRGEAVIVHGRLRSHSWSREGDPAVTTTLEVEAAVVGHDLNRGTSAFLKMRRSDSVEAEIEAELAEMVAEDTVAETPMDGWGNPKPANSAA